MNAAIGKAASLLIFLLLGIIFYEILGRYFFNRGSIWVHEVSGWIQVLYVFLGGAWAFQTGYFVRVDILFSNLPPRVQAILDVTVGTLLFAFFVWVLLEKGGDFALRSWNRGETSANGLFEGPVWPAKFMIPIGTVLLVLAWISHTLRQILRIIDPARADAHLDTHVVAG